MKDYSILVTLLQLLWSSLVVCNFPEDFPTEFFFSSFFSKNAHLFA